MKNLLKSRKAQTIAVMSIELLFFGVAAIEAGASFFSHKDVFVPVLNAVIWFLLFCNTTVSYKVTELEEELEGLRDEENNLIQAILMIKDANEQGVTVRDLEQRGIFKMEVMAVNLKTGEKTMLGTTPPPAATRPFEQIIKRASLKKRKEKVIN